MNFGKLEAHLNNMMCEFDVKEYDLIVKQNGKEVFRKMAGFSDAAGTKPINENNLRWIYSMTKVITSITIMRLIEKGLLNLNDLLSKYLPEYNNMTVKSESGLVPAKNTIRIWHLLSMQSGMDYFLDSQPLKEARKNPKATTREIVRAMASKPLCFEPETDALYGLSHDVLAAVAEVICGKTWYTILKEELFSPLGITDIGFHPSNEQKSRFTQQYCYDEKSNKCLVHNMNNMFCLSDIYESAGAGLFCKTEDYSVIIDSLANGGIAYNGYRVLSQESINKMRENRIKHNGFFIKDGYGYGLGVRTLVDRNAAKTITGDGEFGWDGAASSYNLIDPENHLSIVFSTHILGTNLFNSNLSPKTCNLIYELLGI